MKVRLTPPGLEHFSEEESVTKFVQISGAVYKGSHPELKGKTALVRVYSDCVLAQFDDLETKLGIGWHPFTRDDFEAVEAGDLEDEGPVFTELSKR